MEDLAVMVQKGFADTQERMVEKGGFDDFKSKTEKTLYNIDIKLQSVDKRLDSIEKVLGPLVHVADSLKR